MRNVPPTSASNRSTELVIPSGTIQVCTATRIDERPIHGLRGRPDRAGEPGRGHQCPSISARPSVQGVTNVSPTSAVANGRRIDHAARAIHKPEPTIVSITTAHIE